MSPFLRLFGITCVFMLALVSWMLLGGVTTARTTDQSGSLSSRVQALWGSPQSQQAPTAALVWRELTNHEEEFTQPNGEVTRKVTPVWESKSAVIVPNQTRIDAGLKLDERRKGLMWFPLYDVTFAGGWRFPIETTVPAGAEVQIGFAFPDAEGLYDNFTFVVDGVDVARSLHTEAGQVTATIPGPLHTGQIVTLSITYSSRGMTEWRYVPSKEVGQVEDFQLALQTDFAAIDFPAMTLSPTSKSARSDGPGWQLDWTFARLVTGQSIGMTMPTRIQPGELASMLAFSAPIPLALYFVWIYVLGLLKRYEIHPVNYLFLAAAFFSFNLLFAYTADILPVEWAFGIASAVSVLLAVSYLRLVVGARFALFEAGGAQLLYQVGFGVAHFYDGYTGITITVLGILTLFALMQLTGRIQWSTVFASEPVGPEPTTPRPAL
jgi:hypothetical protein